MGIGIGMGIGLARKALFVMTGGLSGRVFKDDSKKKRTAKAPARQVRAERQPKATPLKRETRRPKPRTARKATAPKVNGTASALDRIAKLHGQGALTDEEFTAAKARILGTTQTPKEPAASPTTYPAVEANVAAARRLADMAANDREAPVASIGAD